MPNAPRAEKRKNTVGRNNQRTKRMKKKPETIEPERGSDSEVGLETITLRNAPAADTTGRSSPLHFDYTNTTVSSPIRQASTTSASWPNSIAHAPSGRPAPSRQVLPPSNPPSSSPVPASIVSVGLRATTNQRRIQSPHPSSSVSQRVTSSPLRLEVPQTPRTPQSIASNSQRYGNRSKLSAGDLRVTAVLETTSLLMEKHLLTEQPFPTDPELKLVRPQRA